MSLADRFEAMSLRYASAKAANVANPAPSEVEVSRNSQVSHSHSAAIIPASDEDFRKFRNFRIRDSETAEETLERFAAIIGIDWHRAMTQFIPGDIATGAAQMAADEGDGVELACVACWLQLLVARAHQQEPQTMDVHTDACETRSSTLNTSAPR